MNIGGYEIEREIGRGGQAIVYLARDASLGRQVALKVMTGLGGVTESALARFRREAEVTSRLDHPGICPVHDAGLDDGTPYIVMRFVEGETLSDVIRRRSSDEETVSVHFDFSDAQSQQLGEDGGVSTSATRLSRDEQMRTLEVIEEAARALHVAHENGIVHRDIKPGNIMWAASGPAVVLDFGLASVDDGSPGLTHTGDVMGTPAYMSPEQIRSGIATVDRRTDVYSLGVTLYEAVTGRRPFEAPTRERLYQVILEGHVEDPRALVPNFPKDLALVIATAMERDLDRRYRTCADLAEELRRVREGEPVHARAPGVLVRTVRWMQRNRAQTVAMVLALVVAVASTQVLASRAREKVAQEKADVEEQLRRATQRELDRAEEERTRLARREADELFLRRMDTLAGRFGFMQHGITGEMNYAPLLSDFHAAFSDFGLPLDGKEELAALPPRIAAIRARDAELAKIVMRSLYRFLSLYEVLEIPAAASRLDSSAPADVERRQTVARRFATSVADFPAFEEALEQAEVDPDIRVLSKAVRRLRRHGDGEPLKDLAAKVDVDARSNEYLDLLIGALYGLDDYQEESGKLMDEAILRAPSSFILRIARAGAELSEMGAGRGDVTQAIIDLECACALDPESGVAYSMLASVHMLRRKPREALRAAERAAEVEPETAGVWLLLSQLRMYARDIDGAIAACEKALEIDPSLQQARQLLDSLAP